MEWPKKLIYLSTPSGLTTIGQKMFVDWAQKAQLKTKFNFQPAIRPIELELGISYYAKTKGKQPRTVFVRKRGYE